LKTYLYHYHPHPQTQPALTSGPGFFKTGKQANGRRFRLSPIDPTCLEMVEVMQRLGQIMHCKAEVLRQVQVIRGVLASGYQGSPALGA
jgi:hypothetical protein